MTYFFKLWTTTMKTRWSYHLASPHLTVRHPWPWDTFDRRTSLTLGHSWTWGTLVPGIYLFLKYCWPLDTWPWEKKWPWENLDSGKHLTRGQTWRCDAIAFHTGTDHEPYMPLSRNTMYFCLIDLKKNVDTHRPYIGMCMHRYVYACVCVYMYICTCIYIIMYSAKSTYVEGRYTKVSLLLLLLYTLWIVLRIW